MDMREVKQDVSQLKVSLQELRSYVHVFEQTVHTNFDKIRQRQDYYTYVVFAACVCFVTMLVLWIL